MMWDSSLATVYCLGWDQSTTFWWLARSPFPGKIQNWTSSSDSGQCPMNILKSRPWQTFRTKSLTSSVCSKNIWTRKIQNHLRRGNHIIIHHILIYWWKQRLVMLTLCLHACHAHGTYALLQQLQTWRIMSARASQQMEFNFNIICDTMTSTSTNLCIWPFCFHQ